MRPELLSGEIRINGVNVSPTMIAWAAFIVLLLLFDLSFHQFFPLHGERMGHDYKFTMPNLMNGHIWFRNNGFSVPWFTPSLCAGQAFFADPQSLYYSLPQLFTILAGPLAAAYWTLLLDAALMFWGGYLLMRRLFATGLPTAILASGMLMFNGFLPYRLAIGHITFHGFAMTPWIALLLLLPLRRAASGIMAALAAGVLLAYWVHSGFGSMALAGILSILALTFLYGLNGGAMTRFAARGTLAGLTALGLAAEKLAATSALMSHFPRDFYPIPGATSIFDAIIMMASSLFLPSRWVYDIGNQRLVHALWEYMPHEWAYGFGITPALLFAALLADRLRRQQWRLPAAPRQILLSAALLACLILPVTFNVWNDQWQAILKALPVIKSISTPLRWTIVYIPVFAIALGLLLERARWKRSALLVGACLLTTALQTIVEPRQYFLGQNYDIRPEMIADHRLRSGEFTPVIRTLDTLVAMEIAGKPQPLEINDTFLTGASQLYCYNPIFGYQLEKFSAAGLTTGPVLIERDGALNLKNPACYMFPEENGCRTDGRFRADQNDEARDFASYRPYRFAVSPYQMLAGLLTEATLILLCLSTIGWLSWRAWQHLTSGARR